MSVVDSVKEGLDKANKKTGEVLAGTLESAEQATSKVTETASKATETVAQVAGNTTGGKVAQGAEGGSKPRYVRVTYPEPALVEPEKWEGKPITEAFNRVHPVEK
ncbi:hypothetical protein BDY24DRAFT_412782 [Mrakia frigida]|uniref:uncharacterized protein n=1 Tax=Mrakia frigida TaxID=29902 RepID=UPI003FCC2409